MTAIEGPTAVLNDLKKFRLVSGDLIEARLDGSESHELSVTDLERSLAERLKGWEVHIKDLVEITR